MVGFSHQSGPNVATTLGTADVSARAFGFGASIGGVASSTPGFDFVPFAGATYNAFKGTATLGGTSSSSSDDYFELTIGAGFVLNKVLTIRPAVSFPMGLDGADPSYGIAFSFNFGSSTRSALRRR